VESTLRSRERSRIARGPSQSIGDRFKRGCVVITSLATALDLCRSEAFAGTTFHVTRELFEKPHAKSDRFGRTTKLVGRCQLSSGHHVSVLGTSNALAPKQDELGAR
jgi:hypothetical protein